MELIGQAGLTGVFLVDVGVGVVFAMLVFSLAASTLNEAIAGVLNLRGAYLRRGIARLVRDEALRAVLLEHPLIAGLKGPAGTLRRIAGRLLPGGGGFERTPSSIPRAAFARALVEALVLRREALVREMTGRVEDTGQAVSGALEALDGAIDGLALDARTKARLRDVVAGPDPAVGGKAVAHAVERLEADLADWFEAGMDRVTGWYVRRTRAMLFVLGTLSALAVNFDVIGHAAQLARDEAFRRAALAQAGAAVETGAVAGLSVDSARTDAATGPMAAVEASGAAVERLAGGDAAVLGWAGALRADPVDWLRRVASWMLVGLACTLGGPFWFDVLRTVLRVRAGAIGLDSDLERLRRALRGGGRGDAAQGAPRPDPAPAGRPTAAE